MTSRQTSLTLNVGSTSVSNPNEIVSYCHSKVGSGEDAEPVNIIRTSDEVLGGALAVFDGLGGAGNDRYTSNDFTQFTGASLASGAAANAFSDFVREMYIHPVTKDNHLTVTAYLTEKIKKAFAAVLDEYTKVPTQLQTNMQKILPTTFAGAVYESSGHRIICDVLWAGDSRVYALSPSGLELLSLDDVVKKEKILDKPMDLSVAAMTNCLQHKKEFQLNLVQYTFQKPIIIFASTDGFFGYIKSPVQIEYVLIDALLASESYKQWIDVVEKVIDTISGDDHSLAIACVGWSDFGSLRAAFGHRIDQLKDMLEHTRDGTENIEHVALSQYRDHYRARIFHAYTLDPYFRGVNITYDNLPLDNNTTPQQQSSEAEVVDPTRGQVVEARDILQSDESDSDETEAVHESEHIEPPLLDVPVGDCEDLPVLGDTRPVPPEGREENHIATHRGTGQYAVGVQAKPMRRESRDTAKPKPKPITLSKWRVVWSMLIGWLCGSTDGKPAPSRKR